MLKELIGNHCNLYFELWIVVFFESQETQSIFLLFRMLVYEYVDNGTLEQWLHGDVGDISPLTWDIRMTVILGTAKAYVIRTSFTVCVCT